LVEHEATNSNKFDVMLEPRKRYAEGNSVKVCRPAGGTGSVQLQVQES